MSTFSLMIRSIKATPPIAVGFDPVLLYLQVMRYRQIRRLQLPASDGSVQPGPTIGSLDSIVSVHQSATIRHEDDTIIYIGILYTVAYKNCTMVNLSETHSSTSSTELLSSERLLDL